MGSSRVSKKVEEAVISLLRIQYDNNIIGDFLLNRVSQSIDRLCFVKDEIAGRSVLNEFNKGLKYINVGEYAEASASFSKAEQFADAQFADFEDHLLMTKIQILSCMMYCHYFYDGPNGEDFNVNRFQSTCVSKGFVYNLEQSPTVQQAIRLEFGPKSFFPNFFSVFSISQNKSKRVLMKMYNVLAFLDEYCGITFHLMKTMTEFIDWSKDFQPDVHKANPTDSVKCMIVSGSRFITGNRSGRIVVLDAVAHSRFQLRGLTEAVECLAMASQHKLFSGSSDGSIRAWDLIERTQVACFEISADTSVRCMCTYSGLLFSGSSGVVKVWNTHTGLEIKKMDCGGGTIRALLVEDDKLYVGGWSVTVWNAESLELIAKLENDSQGNVNSLAIDRKHDRLYVGNSEHNIAVWDVITHTLVKILDLAGHLVNSHPIGGRLFVYDGKGTMQVWNLLTDRPEPTAGIATSEATSFHYVHRHRVYYTNEKEEICVKLLLGVPS